MEDDALTAIERAVGSLSQAIERYEQLVPASGGAGTGNRAESTQDASSDERIRKLVLATEELKDRLRSFQQQ